MSDFSHHVLLLDAKQKRLNAGPKARLDTAFFLKQLGFQILTIPTSRSRYWQRLIAWTVEKMDWVPLEYYVIWCQFPIDKVAQAVIRSARLKGLKTVAFVHDIEGLKYSAPDWNRVAQEIDELKLFTCVLSLNETTGKILQSNGVAVGASLGLWDYACSTEPNVQVQNVLNKRVVFAGNLASEKSPFIYQLDSLSHLSFELFGQGWKSTHLRANNVRYLGSFMPDSPPFTADGAVGLVWDGTEIDDCCGNFGAYLAFNTPHKASMYLSRGLPIAIWKNAAVAPLIKYYQAGMLIASLQELETRMVELTNEQYAELAFGAARLGKKIRSGFFIKSAAQTLNSSLQRKKT